MVNTVTYFLKVGKYSGIWKYKNTTYELGCLVFFMNNELS
jgi:hypothetical protein